MMILNLINTIAIAIGIGTSVNTNNLTYEKKQKKRANETVYLVNETRYTRVSELYNTNNYDQKAEKYYLGENTNTPHYYDRYVDIYNTSYTLRDKDMEHYTAYCVNLYQINNYRDTSLVNVNINIQYNLYTHSANARDHSYEKKLIKVAENQQFTNYFDNTITNVEQVRTIYNTLRTNYSQTNTYDETRNISSNWVLDANMDDTYTQIRNSQVTIPRIEAHSNIQIAVLSEVYNDPDTGAWLPDGQMYVVLDNVNNAMQIQGTLDNVDINYEVVDIPSIMFTILTLPFSFISQAFNLTIFPGTPYEINFSNLFLTIIAIFVLLWLIKHIFK